jgi:hypothetical protein
MTGFYQPVQMQFDGKQVNTNLKTLIPQGFQGFSFCIWDVLGTGIGQVKANG